MHSLSSHFDSRGTFMLPPIRLSASQNSLSSPRRGSLDGQRKEAEASWSAQACARSRSRQHFDSLKRDEKRLDEIQKFPWLVLHGTNRRLKKQVWDKAGTRSKQRLSCQAPSIPCGVPQANTRWEKVWCLLLHRRNSSLWLNDPWYFQSRVAKNVRERWSDNRFNERCI